jgi:UDP-glucose 4-epimerase
VVTGAALVTGASGFVGGHLVQALRAHRIPVRVLVRQAGGWPADVDVVTGTMEDAAALARAADGVGTVFHLAAKVHDVSERGDSGAHDRVTVDGTARLLEACRSTRPAFVFLSSLAVYGATGEACLDEDAPTRPTTPYGAAKLRAETLLFEWAAATGAPACALQPPMVYGPGCKGNLVRMVRAIDRGWFPPVRHPGNRRSLIAIEDLVEALLLAATHPAARGRRFIVTDGRIYSSRDIYDALRHALGRPSIGWTVPVWPLRVAARLGDWGGALRGRRLPFDSLALDRLIGSACFSSARIVRELGFVPRGDFADGAVSVVRAYRGA